MMTKSTKVNSDKLKELKEYVLTLFDDEEYEEAQEAMEEYLFEYEESFPNINLSSEDSELEKKIKDALKGTGVPDLKGPFKRKIMVCEWLHSSSGQDEHSGFDYEEPIISHYGFSLHKDKEVMKKFIARDKRNESRRRSFVGLPGDARRKFPSWWDDSIFSEKEAAKEIFVNPTVHKFVCNNGLGVYLSKKSRKFHELYLFVRGQYGQVYKTTGKSCWYD